MKNIAIITPCILPVPNVLGGAVEELIYKIVAQNEKENLVENGAENDKQDEPYHIDLFTVYHKKLEDIHLKYTDFIFVKSDALVKECDRTIDYMVRTCHKKRSHRVVDFHIKYHFLKRDYKAYDYVIFENITSTYRTIRRYLDDHTKVFFHLHNDVDVYRAVSDFEIMSKAGDTVLAVSDYSKKALQQVVPSVHCEIFHNSVDRHSFAPQNIDLRKSFLESYQLKEDAFVFLFSGRIIPEKGVLQLVKAFELVHEKHENVYLMITGKAFFERNNGTPYSRNVARIATKDDHIIFSGFVPPKNMPNLYGAVNCVVLPTMIEEAFGMVALEVMAMEVPFIGTKSGSVQDIVGTQYPILVDKSSRIVQNLFEAMEKVYAFTPEELLYRKECARKRMAEHLEYDDSFYLSHLKQLLENEGITVYEETNR